MKNIYKATNGVKKLIIVGIILMLIPSSVIASGILSYDFLYNFYMEHKDCVKEVQKEQPQIIYLRKDCVSAFLEGEICKKEWLENGYTNTRGLSTADAKKVMRWMVEEIVEEKTKKVENKIIKLN